MDDDFSANGDLEFQARDASSNGGDDASLGVVKKEIKMLNIVRTFVFASMITLAAVAGNVVFVVTRMQEEATCHAQFVEQSQKLVENFLLTLETQLDAALALTTSLGLQAASKTTNVEWPFVSFEEFDLRCTSYRRLAQASSVSFAPVLAPEMREPWQVYAAYVGEQNALVSPVNDTETYLPHEGHPHELDGESVWYYKTGRTYKDGIYYMEKGVAITEETATNTLVPVWQRSPSPQGDDGDSIYMFDQMTTAVRSQAIHEVLQYSTQIRAVMSGFLFRDTNQTDYAYYNTARSALYTPIFSSANRSNVVAVVDMEFQWETFFEGVIDNEDSPPLTLVVTSSCDDEQEFSFEVKGPLVSFMGPGDLHQKSDDSFDAPIPVNSTYEAFDRVYAISNETAPSTCGFRVSVYATKAFRNYYMTSLPKEFQFLVYGILFLVVGVFLCYDCVVESRSNAVVESAKRTDALVSSLFPSAIKKRMLEQAAKRQKAKKQQQKNKLTGWQVSATSSDDMDTTVMDHGASGPLIHTPKRRLKSLLDPTGAEMENLLGGDALGSEPIADLYPNASVMFADLAGFTAWSSERDPSQVFTLLETLYSAMDKAARRFGVFKVETIGDCYVAASGLPEQRDDHVEILVRFARACLLRQNELCKALEATLGPGTAELALRTGVHSGAVTAGVLRGEKARFQLFGDTMNFASRMESTGVKNKIQLSEATANILISRGKAHWVKAREDKVVAKGKGELQTFFLQLGSSTNSEGGSMVSSDESSYVDISEVGTGMPGQERLDKVFDGVIGANKITSSLDRLVNWNTQALAGLLKKVVLSRRPQDGKASKNFDYQHYEGETRDFTSEMEMVITLPSYDPSVIQRVHNGDANLSRKVMDELRNYVAAIASGYRDNSFHNFEHASHVILSATKLLKRISYADGHTKEEGVTTEDIHHYTYGISSDALTQFAVVFAALIHDVGHTGVPNGQLAKECPDVAERYLNKSLAEQRSVDVALELLKLPRYDNLRACICGTEAEQKRFRQLLINCVLATDIFDKDLKARRDLRWDQAFHKENAGTGEDALVDLNRKATIVLEHVIQASDVSHTMQHWHIYLKWNERLFNEMYAAFLAGRSDKDPSEGWYRGEIWFFDYYVIPLAKKLDECGVFGVSSHEYLAYAVQNRNEWEQRGEETVRSMLERFHEKQAAGVTTKKKKNKHIKKQPSTVHEEWGNIEAAEDEEM